MPFAGALLLIFPAFFGVAALRPKEKLGTAVARWGCTKEVFVTTTVRLPTVR